MEIIKLGGLDQRLYYIVAHLVMDEEVLSYNLNYPYKTSSEYLWFVGTEHGTTIGFIPVKLNEEKAVINNYYIADDDSAVLLALLKESTRVLHPDFDIEAVVQVRHTNTFEQCGFSIMLYWKRYVKMKLFKVHEKTDEEPII